MYLTIEDLNYFVGAKNLNTLKQVLESIEFSGYVEKTRIGEDIHYRLDTITFKQIRSKCYQKDFTKKYNITQLREYFKRQNIHQILARSEFVKLQTDKQAYKCLNYQMSYDDLFRLFCAVNRKYVDYDTPANRLLFEEYIEKHGEIK